MKVILTTPWQRLWRLLAGEKAVLTRVFLIAGFGGLISLSLPLGIQAIINFIMAGRASTSLVLLVSFVLLGILVSGLLIIRQQWLIEYFQQRLFARASLEFSLRIPKIKFEELNNNNPSELMNRFFDVLTIQKGLSKLIIDFSTSLLQVFFGLLLLALYHPLFIIFDVAIVLLVVVLIRVSMRRGIETSLVESKWKYKNVAWLEELAVNIEPLRMKPEVDLHFTKTDKLTENYIEARQDHFRVLVRHYIALLLFKLLVAAGLLILGSLLVIQREIGIGQFVAAEIIILLIINSVEKIILNLESVYDVLTGLEKVGAVTDLELEERGKVTDLSPNAPLLVAESIEVKEGNYMAELEFEHFSIQKGERIYLQYDHPMFVRTMVLLLSGRYLDYSGHVLFKGRSVKSLDLAIMREVTSEFWGRDELFTTSIIENIRMGREHISSDKIEKTLGRMGLLKDIRRLPEGENTILTPFSNLLSPVIVRGIKLARNIVGNPELLIVDSEQLPSDPRRYQEALDFIFHPDHSWAIVFFGEAKPELSRFDKTYVHRNGKLELQHNRNATN